MGDVSRHLAPDCGLFPHEGFANRATFIAYPRAPSNPSRSIGETMIGNRGWRLANK